MSININQVRALAIGCKEVKEKLPADSVFEYHIGNAIYSLDKMCAIWDEVAPGNYEEPENYEEFDSLWKEQLEFNFESN